MSIIDTNQIRAKLEALRTQLADIQAEMQKLGTFLALADEIAAKQTPTTMTTAAAGALMAMDRAIMGSGKTKRERIIETTTEILSDGTRRSSRYLVAELAARGVEIGGADDAKKAAALSAYLSKEDDVFDSSVKMGGWTLSTLLKTARPDNARTLSGLFNNGPEATHP